MDKTVKFFFSTLFEVCSLSKAKIETSKVPPPKSNTKIFLSFNFSEVNP